MSQDSLKQRLGLYAATLVQDGMLVGLGTGTTATFFIQSLIERCREGLSITAVATSKHSASMAQAGGIPVLDMDSVTCIDLTVDGADEIDPLKRIVKGGGGALLREKIVASSSREMVVVVDETKLVDRLGTFGLPLEIVPFGYAATLHKLSELGYTVSLRRTKEGAPFITDNQNYTADITFPSLLANPEEHHQKIRQVTGVIETGFFFGLAGRVLIARSSGVIDTW